MSNDQGRFESALARFMTSALGLAGAWNDRAAAWLREHNITMVQFKTLLLINEGGRLTLAQLGKALSRNRYTISGIVDRLEDEGLVTRGRNSEDRRIVTVTITEKGQDLAADLIETILPSVAELGERILGEFSREEYHAIETAIDHLGSVAPGSEGRGRRSLSGDGLFGMGADEEQGTFAGRAPSWFYDNDIVWGIGRAITNRTRSVEQEKEELGGRFQRSEPPAMKEIVAHLHRINYNPRGPYLFSLASTYRPDLAKYSREFREADDKDPYPYPKGFEKLVFKSIDGTPLMGVVGIHRDGIRRPGVVFCHGFFGSRNKNYIMDPMIEAYNDWGYNVMAFDMRNFGESWGLSDAPTTGGWKEGLDVLGACRYLGGLDEVTTVGAVGYSLGGGSVLNAAYRSSEYPYLTGGALAWSGYASVRDMTTKVSNRPPVSDPFFAVYGTFAYLTEIRRLEARRKGKGEEVSSFLSERYFSPQFSRYVEEISVPYYGVSADEIYRQGSPSEFISDIQVPTLLINAEDDPVCPVDQVEEMIGKVNDNPNVEIWILPVGFHCAFQGFDQKWYRTVMRDFLDYWSDRPETP